MPATPPLPAHEVGSPSDGAPVDAPVAPVALVQPHGVLLVLDEDHCVVTCSATVEALLGAPPADVVGRPLALLVGTDLVARIAARRDDGSVVEPMVVVLGRQTGGSLDGQQVEVRVHAAGRRTVVELEPAVGGESAPDDDATLRTAMTRLAAARTLDQLTELLAAQVRDLTGYDRVVVQRHDGGEGAGVVAEAHRDGLAATVLPVSPGPRGSDARWLVVADVDAAPVPLVPPVDPDTGLPADLSRASLRSPAPDDVASLRAAGVTAAMSLPIMIDDQEWGRIECHHHAGPHRPGHEVRSSTEFFTQVAAHLVAHRVRADTREAATSTRGELAKLLARLSASVGDVLDALFADPGLLDVFGATGAANLFEGELRCRGEVLDVEVMQQVADALHVPGRYATSADRLTSIDPRFADVAGIADGVLRVGTTIERWGLWFRTDGTRWEPWHLEAADELGRHVNSLLLLRSREQVAMAESMQRSVVLDRAPQLPDVELVARYRPASSYQLGGDWWDAFELDGRRLAFVVGDVAGHGVAAASAMTQVRTALRAYLYDGHGPAACLDRLDRLMDGLLDVGIATALVAVLDRSTGIVEIASAGHLDPILVAPDGTAREVAVDRRPLLGVGVGEAAASTLDLSGGGLLLLFTDGLVERRGTGTDVQTARLIDLATGGLPLRPHDDPARWADALLDALDASHDDTTLLAVRCG